MTTYWVVHETVYRRYALLDIVTKDELKLLMKHKLVARHDHKYVLRDEIIDTTDLKREQREAFRKIIEELKVKEK